MSGGSMSARRRPRAARAVAAASLLPSSRRLSDSSEPDWVPVRVMKRGLTASGSAPWRPSMGVLSLMRALPSSLGSL